MKSKILILLSFTLIILGMGTASISAESTTITKSSKKITAYRKHEVSSKKVVKKETEKEQIAEEAVVYSPNTYPIGQCTWGVKELAPWAGNNWGNANDWASSAVSEGFTVETTPKVGAILVWSDGGYGHVAFVTEVGEDGLIQVQESNYAGNMTINNYRGWFNPNDGVTPGLVSYIYPKN